MHVTKEGLWMCAKCKCAENPGSFNNKQLLQKHQQDIKCDKCEKKITEKFSAPSQKSKLKEKVDFDNAFERNHTVSTNIARLDLDGEAISDLIVVPLDPFC